jgi:chromosome segregation ATPase
MTMNHSQITDALNAVRTAGHEFTKAFNNLSDVIEAMAQEHTDLIGEVLAKDKMIADRDETLATMRKEIDSTYSRAIKAEHDGWELAQTLAQTKQARDTFEMDFKVACSTNQTLQRELDELRPFRQTVDNMGRDLSAREDTITSLRSEVSKLLEIILNVATSVDSVVNKPKAEDIARVEPGVVTFGTSPPDSPQTVVHKEDDQGYPLHSYPRAVGA